MVIASQAWEKSMTPASFWTYFRRFLGDVSILKYFGWINGVCWHFRLVVYPILRNPRLGMSNGKVNHQQLRVNWSIGPYESSPGGEFDSFHRPLLHQTRRGGGRGSSNEGPGRGKTPEGNCFCKDVPVGQCISIGGHVSMVSLSIILPFLLGDFLVTGLLNMNSSQNKSGNLKPKFFPVRLFLLCHHSLNLPGQKLFTLFRTLQTVIAHGYAQLKLHLCVKNKHMHKTFDRMQKHHASTEMYLVPSFVSMFLYSLIALHRGKSRQLPWGSMKGTKEPFFFFHLPPGLRW